MTIEHALEFGGMAVALLAAVFDYFKEKKNAKTAHVARAVIILLLGTTLTTVLIIRWEIIPRIESNQELARLISSEQKLKTTLDLCAAALPVAKTAPTPFQDRFNERLE